MQLTTYSTQPFSRCTWVRPEVQLSIEQDSNEHSPLSAKRILPNIGVRQDPWCLGHASAEQLSSVQKYTSCMPPTDSYGEERQDPF